MPSMKESAARSPPVEYEDGALQGKDRHDHGPQITSGQPVPVPNTPRAASGRLVGMSVIGT